MAVLILVIVITIVCLAMFFMMAGIMQSVKNLNVMAQKNNEILQGNLERLGTISSDLRLNVEDIHSMIQTAIEMQELLNQIKDSGITAVDRLEKATHEMCLAKASTEIRLQQLADILVLQESVLTKHGPDWVLKKDDVDKHFEPGRLLKVKNRKDKTETTYSYVDGSVQCQVLREGKLKAEIFFNSFGAPLSGKSYDDDGELVDSYEYDMLGQVVHKG